MKHGTVVRRIARTSSALSRVLKLEASKNGGPPTIAVNLIHDVPWDVVRAAPRVLELLSNLRNSNLADLAVVAAALQLDIMTIDEMLDEGVMHRHISAIRRGALMLGIDMTFARELERGDSICFYPGS